MKYSTHRPATPKMFAHKKPSTRNPSKWNDDWERPGPVADGNGGYYDTCEFAPGGTEEQEINRHKRGEK